MSDDFLLIGSHFWSSFPVNPYWQLRADFISMKCCFNLFNLALAMKNIRWTFNFFNHIMLFPWMLFPWLFSKFTFHLSALAVGIYYLQLEITFLCSLILQITGLAFSSIDSNYIYVQGVDYEVIVENLINYYFTQYFNYLINYSSCWLSSFDHSAYSSPVTSVMLGFNLSFRSCNIFCC